MGRAADRILGACLLVVRFLTAIAALAVVAGIVYLLLQPGSGPASEGAEGAAPDVPEPAAGVLPAPRERRIPLGPLSTKGTTRFARRLEVGEELRSLSARVTEVGAERARLKERLERAMPHLLRADLPPDAVSPASTLALLVSPPRDLKTLVLAGATEEDPLGAGLPVRVWTLEKPYPDEELSRVSNTLDHIARHVRRDVPDGIDVVVTPNMGHDVFPYQTYRARAIGVYYAVDGYCVALSGLPPEVRQEVVEHELIHAYCWRVGAQFSSSRFVAEGLAEYLRLLEPGDPRLGVPEERLADHLADLDLILSRLLARGVAVEEIDPVRLVELSPREFYALGHSAYLIAQAAMAYLGGDLIEDALRRGSDAILVGAVRAMDWRAFLKFVGEPRKRGRVERAVIVEDLAPEGEKPPPSDRETFARALDAIGAAVPPDAALDPALAMRLSVEALGATERIGAALRAASATPSLRVYVEVSDAMDRRIRLATTPAPLADALGGAPDGETPREVAFSLLARLCTRPEAEIVALAEQRGTGIDRVAPLDLSPLRDPPALVTVVVVGSPAVARRASGIGPASGAAREPDATSGFVLVIDLSPDGQGLEIARILDAPDRPAAYWNPLVP